MSLENLLQHYRNEGRLDSVGGFTLDDNAYRLKYKELLSHLGDFWALSLVQSATCKNAAKVVFNISRDIVVFAYKTKP